VTTANPDALHVFQMVMQSAVTCQALRARRIFSFQYNVKPIWLPPNSSHFLQVLDVGIFGAYKTNYRNTRAKPTKPKLEGKILRALKAWHITAYCMTIWNAWRVSGLPVVTIHHIPFFMTVDQGNVRELVLRHCPDGQEFIARLVQD
jgi:hypothetical protein